MTLLNAGASAVTSPVATWVPPPPSTLGPGAAFGDRYTIVEEVGAGGMGRVYKAIDRLLKATVALKVMSAAATHAEARQRFQRELSVARSITHSNVCRLHDLGEIEGTAYISMEYVEGQTLDDLIRSVGVLSTKQTLTVGRQICAALEAIHEAGVVHRDLKPSNIMLDRAGRALVMDFGMAYQRGDDRLTNAGAVVGTLAYLSPEQARGGEAHPRSDVYALGLILYEMLTGRRPPGDGAPLPLALRERSDACPPPSRFSPEVPLELDVLVLRCLERDPEDRLATARAVDDGLALLQAGLTMTGILPKRPPPPRRLDRRALVAGAAVAAVLLAAGLWLALRPSRVRPVTSVAVLPLEYQGPPEQAHLRNVVPLLVSERLRTISGLQVAPFASSRAFAGTLDAGEVSRQLGVGAVLTGTVAFSGSRLEIVGQVIRAGGPERASRLQVAGSADQLLAIAERLASSYAESLGVPTPARGGGTRNQEALEHYFTGRSLFEGWDMPANLVRAEAESARAVELDPLFAEALALRAQIAARRYLTTKDSTLLPAGDEAARRATELAPTLPEAHTATGLLYLARGRSAEAAASFERGLELAPGDDSLCRRVAYAYSELGRDREAEAMYRRAVQLRPSYWQNHSALGIFLLRRGRLDEAKPVFRQVLELRPEADTGFVNLAAAHILAGEHRDAEPLLLAALRINPTWETHNNLGAVYYALGRFEEAAREWKAAVGAGGSDAILFSNLGDALRQMAHAADEAGAADQSGQHRRQARDAYEQAIARGRDTLSARPDDQETRATLAMALAGRGDCPAAREQAGRVSRAGATPAGSYYAAVAYALCGVRDAAVREAVRAIEGGIVSDVRTNPDLKPLLDDPLLRQRLR